MWIALTGQKGGVGKSTTAICLAAEGVDRGMRVLLVDADPQGSATRWAQRRAALDSAVLPVDGTGARRGWQRGIPADAQTVVVDAAAGAMADALAPFLEAADAVVVPGFAQGIAGPGNRTPAPACGRNLPSRRTPRRVPCIGRRTRA